MIRVITPPWETPHGLWYIAGEHGIAMGATLLQALVRYSVRA
jgi:hypothetical protein